MPMGVTRGKPGLPKLSRTDLLQATFGTVLAYGPGGAGKTRSIRTLKRYNPLILATELGETHGLLSLASDDIPFIPIHSHAEIIEVIKILKSKPGKIEYDQTEFGAVILDSLTQWGEMPLDRYMELKGWEDLHGPNTAGSGKDPRTADGFLAEKGRQLYKELFELHGHLYIIAREGTFGGQDGEPTYQAPELPGQKLPREVPGWPDATVRLRVIGGQHRMITQGEGGSPARVRLPVSFEPLPSRCMPDIDALIRCMTGDVSARSLLIPPPAGKGGTQEKVAPATPPAAAVTR
jgi:hypothetical protein